MRPPKPKPKTEPKPKAIPIQVPRVRFADSKVDPRGYETCDEGGASEHISSLLEQAKGAEEQRRHEDPELAALLQALGSQLECREQQYQAQRRQLRRMRVKLGDAREDADKQAARATKLHGQTIRHWSKVQALRYRLFLFDLQHRQSPSHKFPP